VRLKRDDFKLQIPFPQKLTSDPTSFHRRIQVYAVRLSGPLRINFRLPDSLEENRSPVC